MAGKHISIPALLKIGAGALDNLGIYLKELQLQKVVVLFGCLLYTSPSPRD